MFAESPSEQIRKLVAGAEPEVFTFNFMYSVSLLGARGGVVVKALRYKPEDRGFDSRSCHWNFLET